MCPMQEGGHFQSVEAWAVRKTEQHVECDSVRDRRLDRLPWMDVFVPTGTCPNGAGTVMGLPSGYGYLRHPAGSFNLASMNTEPRANTAWCGQALICTDLKYLLLES